jgi:hypothetical protein
MDGDPWQLKSADRGIFLEGEGLFLPHLETWKILLLELSLVEKHSSITPGSRLESSKSTGSRDLCTSQDLDT